MMVWLFRDRSKDRLTFRQQWRVIKHGLNKGVRHDGCTGVPDFDFGADCCGEHDTYYQLGEITKAEADKRLYECIRKKGYFIIAASYYLGVKIFGSTIWDKYRGINENKTIDDPNRSDAA
jgi:hypothetical protein